MRKEYFFKNVNVPLDEYLICKICGKKYKDVANLSHHIKKIHGVNDIREYHLNYYLEYIPKCLETGAVSDNKLNGYYFGYFEFKKEFTSLKRNLIQKFNRIEKIKKLEPEYYTKYLEFYFWLSRGKKPSEILKFYEFIFNHDSNLYRRLSDCWFDINWTRSGIKKYKSDILNMVKPKNHNIMTVEGWSVRGYNDNIEARNAWLNTNNIMFNTVFSDSSLQKELNSRRNKKYDTLEKRQEITPLSYKYWMLNGMNETDAKNQVSILQKKNSIESIMKRYDCCKDTAVDIQHRIYKKRKNTMNQKSEEYLVDMYKRQDSSSMKYCLNKTFGDVEKAEKLYLELKIKKCVPFGKASKESLTYFIPLYKLVRVMGINREDIRFGVGGSYEYRIYHGKDYFMYDFTILSKKLIIEYDGSYWHQSDTIEFDERKQKLAESFGFKVLRIKSQNSYEYNWKKLKNFINENL